MHTSYCSHSSNQAAHYHTLQRTVSNSFTSRPKCFRCLYLEERVARDVKDEKEDNLDLSTFSGKKTLCSTYYMSCLKEKKKEQKKKKERKRPPLPIAAVFVLHRSGKHRSYTVGSLRTFYHTFK